MSLRRSILSVLITVTVLLIAACSNGAPPTPSATNVDVTLNEWTVQAAPTSVSAGSTQFSASNAGALEHELIVMRTDLAPDALTVAEGKVNEAESGTVIGEIEPDQLPAGGSASATWDLESGSYVLFCNISGHYEQGMYQGFTVN